MELEKQKKSSAETIIKIRECVNCFAVYSPTEDKCPMCGHVPIVEEREAEYEVDESAELQEVTEEEKQVIELNFKTPEECETMQELHEYARANNYKPGWVWYTAKARGWM